MIPLDPRLGENAPKAIEEFFRNVHCRMLFPMHYWNRRAEAAAYLEDDRLTPYRQQIFFGRQAEI
jgi:hypothetical protein